MALTRAQKSLKDWGKRKVPPGQSDQGLDLRRILGNKQSQKSGKEKRETILKATKSNSKENKEI
mgnify:CR=1 FL=1